MRPDMNGAFDEFDDMVEALEEQEDMVECKECFDLFPKTECDKVELGYICPTCRRVMSAPVEPEITSADITTGLYDHEFPDVSEYDPNSTKDWSSEPTVADALSDLITDEYEAIDGYEVADEKIQHAAIDADQKDEILDTLDHIKEEEEEHIEELKDVCPECDSEESEEPEKLEEKLPREPQVYDDNGKLIKVKDPEILKIWGKVMDQAEADGVTSWDDYATQKQIIDKALTPEEIEKLKKVEFEDGSVRAAYESLAEEDTEVLTEAQLLEKPGAFAKAATKAKNFVKKVSNKMSGATANIDDLFYNGYTIIINDPTDTTDAERNSKKYHKSTQVDLNDAERAGAAASKMYPKATVTVRAIDIDITKLDPEVKKLVTHFDSIVAVYRKGSAIRSNVAKINARLKELDLAEDELFATSVEAPKADPETDSKSKPDPDPTPKQEEEDETLEGEEKSIEDYRTEALEILGEKAVAEDYTEESYAAYSPKYDDLARKIKSAKKIETFTDSYLPKLPGIVEKLNKILVPAEDDGLEDESDSSESDRENPTPEDNTSDTKLSEVPEEQLKKLFTAVTGQGVGDNQRWQKILKRVRTKLKELGESLNPEDYKPEDFLEEDLQSEADAVKSIKDTSDTLKSAASGIKNMTSAMKESILNLSPADFAECVDSSRIELWGLEEPEDGVAQAVLIKSYDDVSSEDEQSCHDEMLDLDGMFTFSFTASGKPSLYGWNVEQLRELTQAGLKGISFDDPAYEEAISLAWHIK